MNLFIETTLKDFVVILFDKNNKFVLIKKQLIRKSDALAGEIENLVLNNNYKFSDIKKIYITLGPGSFMGARASYVYAKTFCQVANIPLFTISTTKLLAISNNSLVAHLHSKNELYFVWNEGVETIEEIANPKIFTLEKFIESPIRFVDSFDCSNIFEVKPNYLKDPTIGGN